MLNKLLKKYAKNEKGLTLIELLVVIVILGIIAAIAVVSIGGLLDNSKKDAHVGNAQQMANAAKMWVTGNANGKNFTGATKELTLKDLYDENLLDTMKDPDGGTGYVVGTSKVLITKVGNSFTYTVTLIGGEKQITSVPSDQLERSSVTKVTKTQTPAQ